MRIIIDTDSKTLTAGAEAYPLFSPEAFRVLSRQWLALGWNLGHWTSFSWMGCQLLQLPDDVLRLAEAIWLEQPDVVLETGVYDGGGTLLFASLCRMMGHGRVIAIDREPRPGARAAIERWSSGLVTLIEDDSASPATAARVRDFVQAGERVFAFLDSDHSAAHVATELANYAPLVSPGSYIVVADSNLQDLCHTPEGDPCWARDHPMVAVDAFLAAHPEFVRERRPPLFAGTCDFGELSYFSRSWLRRR